MGLFKALFVAFAAVALYLGLSNAGSHVAEDAEAVAITADISNEYYRTVKVSFFVERRLVRRVQVASNAATQVTLLWERPADLTISAVVAFDNTPLDAVEVLGAAAGEALRVTVTRQGLVAWLSQ